MNEQQNEQRRKRIKVKKMFPFDCASNRCVSWRKSRSGKSVAVVMTCRGGAV